jgi:hypothetical protein
MWTHCIRKQLVINHLHIPCQYRTPHCTRSCYRRFRPKWSTSILVLLIWLHTRQTLLRFWVRPSKTDSPGVTQKYEKQLTCTLVATRRTSFRHSYLIKNIYLGPSYHSKNYEAVGWSTLTI